MVDSLCNEKLDPKARFNMALKIYDRFHKESEINDKIVNQNSDFMALLEKGIVKIILPDNIEL